MSVFKLDKTSMKKLNWEGPKDLMLTANVGKTKVVYSLLQRQFGIVTSEGDWLGPSYGKLQFGYYTIDNNGSITYRRSQNQKTWQYFPKKDINDKLVNLVTTIGMEVEK